MQRQYLVQIQFNSLCSWLEVTGSRSSDSYSFAVIDWCLQLKRINEPCFCREALTQERQVLYVNRLLLFGVRCDLARKSCYFLRVIRNISRQTITHFHWFIIFRLIKKHKFWAKEATPSTIPDSSFIFRARIYFLLENCRVLIRVVVQSHTNKLQFRLLTLKH